MEINIEILLAILTIHWILDFVVQTDWQAQNKSKSWDALLAHTVMYSMIWIIPATIILGIWHPNGNVTWHLSHVFYFFCITLVAHTATDYYTSRVNAMLYEKKDIHGFFVSVGFDQLLHMVQLVLTFYFLSS